MDRCIEVPLRHCHCQVYSVAWEDLVKSQSRRRLSRTRRCHKQEVNLDKERRKQGLLHGLNKSALAGSVLNEGHHWELHLQATAARYSHHRKS